MAELWKADRRRSRNLYPARDQNREEEDQFFRRLYGVSQTAPPVTKAPISQKEHRERLRDKHWTFG